MLFSSGWPGTHYVVWDSLQLQVTLLIRVPHYIYPLNTTFNLCSSMRKNLQERRKYLTEEFFSLSFIQQASQYSKNDLVEKLKQVLSFDECIIITSRKLTMIGTAELKMVSPANHWCSPSRVLLSFICQPTQPLTQELPWLSQQEILGCCQRKEAGLGNPSSSHFSFPGSHEEPFVQQSCLLQPRHHCMGLVCIFLLLW